MQRRRDLFSGLALHVVEPLSQPHPLHLVLAQGHHSQIGLQIAVHSSPQKRIEIGGQFSGTLVIAAATDAFPQLQTALGTEILQQRRGHHICTSKVPARFQSDRPNEVRQLLMELFKRVGFAGLCPPVQFFVRHALPPPLRLKISPLALAVPWGGSFSQHRSAGTAAPQPGKY
jgi:hypothetical protein